MGVEEDDDLVAGIHEPFRLVLKGLPVLLEGREVFAHTGLSAYGPAAEAGEMGAPLDIRIALGDHRVDVSAIACVIDPLRCCHVLLRHGSAIIPRYPALVGDRPLHSAPDAGLGRRPGWIVVSELPQLRADAVRPQPAHLPEALSAVRTPRLVRRARARGEAGPFFHRRNTGTGCRTPSRRARRPSVVTPASTLGARAIARTSKST